jgi:RHS repeat-associated protein
MHAYDALNRLTGITYAESAYNVGYAYDQADAAIGCTDSLELGRLTTLTDDMGSTAYCYDRHGNTASKTQTVDGMTMVVRYRYSPANRLSELTYPSGAEIAYARDVQGRITGINRVDGASSVPIVTGATYLPFGPLASLAFDGRATQAWTYDQNYWIDAIGGTALNLDYTTDALGNISGLPSTNPADARVYGYDALSRLTFAKDGSNTLLEGFTYDKTGNRLSKQAGAATQIYEYPAASHRLTTIGAATRSYDAIGSLTDRGDGWTFEYDPRQRLKAVKQNNVVAQINRYNAKGERVAKTAGVTHRFAYNEVGQLLSEHESTLGAGYRQEFVWLDNRPVALLAHGPAYAGEMLHVHSDHLGTPRAITRPAASNTMVWSWPLTGPAFGEHAPLADADGDGVVLSVGLRYPGQYFDVESGLHYNYFRDYEPAIGSYLQVDPMLHDQPASMGAAKPYSYVESNPLDFIDPAGLFKMDPSCSDGSCDDGWRNQVESEGTQWCQRVDRHITDVRRAKCIKGRCEKAVITCVTCEAVQSPDGTPVVGIAHSPVGSRWFPEKKVKLCTNSRWNKEGNPAGLGGLVVVHEFAHLCGWLDRGGEGVPDPWSHGGASGEEIVRWGR